MQIHARLIALVMIVWMIVPFVGLIGISFPSRPEKNQQPRLTQIQARKPDSNAQPVAAEIALVDRNGDKIHDLLAEKMMSYAPEQMIDVDILFYNPPSSDTLASIAAQGGIVQEIFSLIPACIAKVPRASIPLLAQLPSVELIEGLATANSTLIQSTQQVQARPYVWDRGYQGNASQAIAILDTGIDATHPDFAGKIIYWHDFTSTGYTSPQDKAEHGTHVASIAAGSGADSIGPFYWETIGGRTNPIVNNYWNYTIQVFTRGTITMNCTWNNTVVSGTPQMHVGWENGTNNEFSGDFSTSPFSYTFGTTLYPGTYSIVLSASNSDATNRSVVAAVKIPVGDSSDNYAAHLAGVAPASKIVALKVLDDTGLGNSADLLSALNWIHVNGKSQAYNITVVSMSLGFDTIVPAVDTAVNNLVNNDGYVVVAAAGNNGTTNDYIKSPGSASACICVGAVNDFDQVAYYSSNGNWANNPTGKPDILAPGGSAATPDEILAANSADQTNAYDPTSGTDPRQPQPYPGNYQQFQGTSMAAPHVAGMAQLIIQAWPGSWSWNPADALKVKQMLCMSAVETGAGENYGGWNQNPPLNRGDKDTVEGWGKASAEAAVNMTRDDFEFFTHYNPTFGTSATSQKIYAARVYLQNGNLYNFTLNVPSGLDLDLYLYMPNCTSSGDPILCNKSVNPSLGAGESLQFNANATGYFYLAVKYISGSSAMTADLYLVKSLYIDVQSPLANGAYYDNASVDLHETVVVLQGTFNQTWYSLDAAANVSFSGNISISLARGFHTVIFYANNSLGSLAWTDLITFPVRTAEPWEHLKITVLSPHNYSVFYNQSDVQFNITFTTDLSAFSTCWFLLDGINQTIFSGNESAWVELGNHQVVFFANDTLGEEIQSPLIFFTVSEPPNWIIVTLLLAVNLLVGIGAVAAASKKH